MRSPQLIGHSETERRLLQEIVEAKYLYPFIKARGLDISRVKMLAPEDCFGALEFGVRGTGKGESMKFFYPRLFSDLVRDDSGVLIHTLKISVTHDPRRCSEHCAATNTLFAEIRLGKKLVAYVIYIEVNLILEAYFKTASSPMRFG